MELPQSRPFEGEGRKKPTHDFLSARSNSTVQQDPMPTSQDGYLKTQDFLQPLERVGIDPTTASSETKSSHVQNQQHVLPGGIGTYTVSHIPYLYHHHHQRVPKPEVSPMFAVADENSNSNCSSGFTLWDESAGSKEKSSKENVRERTNIIADATATMGQWPGMEQRSSFSSRSSLQPSDLRSHGQSFMDMIKSAKGSSQEDDDEELVMKKENNTEDLRVKVDGKGHGNEQKANTPRSKHSATEQRRRSKINDRFQMLRQLIPNTDQKRDKASFLLDVIEYIHFLQKKVDKHEVVPYQGKLMNLRNHQQTSKGTVPVLLEAQAIDMDQQCLNRAMKTTSFPTSSQRNDLFSPASQVSYDAAMEISEKLREEEEEEELPVHRGTISISSVYSQGLLKTLTETLQTSGVDLSKASISVQIKLSKQPQTDEEVYRRVRPRSQSGHESHSNDDISRSQMRKQKKLKKDNHASRNL